MNDKYFKRLSAILSLLLLLQDCNTKLLDNKFSYGNARTENFFHDGDHVDSFEFEDLHGKSQEEEKTSDEKIGDNEIEFSEDRYDKELEVISKQIQKRRRTKRFYAESIILVASFAVTFFGPIILKSCREARRKSQIIKKAREKLDEEKKQINIDWATVDAKERYLQKLAADLDIAIQLIGKMDEIKGDIISLIDPVVLENLNMTKENLKEQIRKANNTKISDLDGSTIGTRTTLIIFASFAVTMGFLIAGLPENTQSIKKLLAVPASSASNSLTKVQRFKKFLLKFGMSAVVGFGLALTALQLGLQHKTCQTIIEKADKVIGESKIALKNVSSLRRNMEKFNTYVDGNYTIVWKEITSKNFTQFIKNAIDTLKDSEEKSSNILSAINNLNAFFKNIKSTNVSGSFNFKEVETLTEKLVNGLLKSNELLNCELKKVRILKILNDRCSKGLGTFDFLWKETMRQRGEKLKNCIANHKHFTKDGVERSVKATTLAHGKSSMCIRNNELKNAIICKKYLKGDSIAQIISSFNGFSKEDVKYFIDNCPLASVDPKMIGSICKVKESASEKARLYEEFSRYNRSSLDDAWDDCKISKAQETNICDIKRSGKDVEYVKDKYKFYDSSSVTKLFNSCILKMTPQDILFICLAHSQGKTSLIIPFKKMYGDEVVSNIINTPGKCPV